MQVVVGSACPVTTTFRLCTTALQVNNLRCAVLRCAVLCCPVLCRYLLCCSVLFCDVLCWVVRFGSVLCCAALFVSVQCCAVLRCSFLCCDVLCCTVWFCSGRTWGDGFACCEYADHLHLPFRFPCSHGACYLLELNQEWNKERKEGRKE